MFELWLSSDAGNQYTKTATAVDLSDLREIVSGLSDGIRWSVRKDGEDIFVKMVQYWERIMRETMKGVENAL